MTGRRSPDLKHKRSDPELAPGQETLIIVVHCDNVRVSEFYLHFFIRLFHYITKCQLKMGGKKLYT